MFLRRTPTLTAATALAATSAMPRSRRFGSVVASIAEIRKICSFRASVMVSTSRSRGQVVGAQPRLALGLGALEIEIVPRPHVARIDLRGHPHAVSPDVRH